MNQTIVQRNSIYLYNKKRRVQYANRALELLGNECKECHRNGTNGNELRIRFKDPDNPMKLRYRTNLVTLHRKICVNPAVREQVELICRDCIIMGGASIGN